MNAARAPSDETMRPTGMLCDRTLLLESLSQYRVTCLFGVTTNCEGLAKTIRSRWIWSELAPYIGAEPVLARVERRERRPVWTVTLKTRVLSGGAATLVSQIVSLTSFVEPSTSLTCSNGWIVTRFLWSASSDTCHCASLNSGSPPMYLPRCGTPIWTAGPWMQCYDE